MAQEHSSSRGSQAQLPTYEAALWMLSNEVSVPRQTHSTASYDGTAWDGNLTSGSRANRHVVPTAPNCDEPYGLTSNAHHHNTTPVSSSASQSVVHSLSFRDVRTSAVQSSSSFISDSPPPTYATAFIRSRMPPSSELTLPPGLARNIKPEVPLAPAIQLVLTDNHHSLLDRNEDFLQPSATNADEIIGHYSLQGTTQQPPVYIHGSFRGMWARFRKTTCFANCVCGLITGCGLCILAFVIMTLVRLNAPH